MSIGMWKKAGQKNCNLIRVLNYEIHPGEGDVKIGKKKISEGELYVGNVSAENRKSIQLHGFTHIIHCLEKKVKDSRWKQNERRKGKLKELHLEGFKDENYVNLGDYLPKCFQFLDEAFSNSNQPKVLVHCFGGVSRSATVACAYIMYVRKIDFPTVLNAMKIDRGQVQMKISFRNQLEFLEKNNYTIDRAFTENSKREAEKWKE